MSRRTYVLGQHVRRTLERILELGPTRDRLKKGRKMHAQVVWVPSRGKHLHCQTERIQGPNKEEMWTEEAL